MLQFKKNRLLKPNPAKRVYSAVDTIVQTLKEYLGGVVLGGRGGGGGVV